MQPSIIFAKVQIHKMTAPFFFADPLFFNQRLLADHIFYLFKSSHIIQPNYIPSKSSVSSFAKEMFSTFLHISNEQRTIGTKEGQDTAMTAIIMSFGECIDERRLLFLATPHRLALGKNIAEAMHDKIVSDAKESHSPFPSLINTPMFKAKKLLHFLLGSVVN